VTLVANLMTQVRSYESMVTHYAHTMTYEKKTTFVHRRSTCNLKGIDINKLWTSEN
jgi:hypothetical protein